MLRVARVRPMHSAGCAVEVLAVTVAGWLADHRERIAFARNAGSLFRATILVASSRTRAITTGLCFVGVTFGFYEWACLRDVGSLVNPVPTRRGRGGERLPAALTLASAAGKADRAVQCAAGAMATPRL